MDGRSSSGMRGWHLRFGLTSRCNYRCRYCLPEGRQEVTVEPSFTEVTEVLQAAQDIGVQRVHYTGGEPTVRRDFVDILQAAKDMGFTQQIVTTNGYRLHRIMDDAVAAGLTRVIVSLDTLDPDRNLNITRRGLHADTLKTVEAAVERLPTLTKISCVMMRQTVEELPAFVEYAQAINSRGYEGQLALKLNQFFPSNPAQLGDEGEEFWKDQFVSEDVILAALAQSGTLVPISRQSIEGDNPSYNYYQVGDTGVVVAVLAMFSWDYPCGGCLKLRVSATGQATVCISQKNAPSLWGMSPTEKRDCFARLTEYRTSPRFDIDNPARKHYRGQLGELRFGRVVGDGKPIDYFRTVLKRDTTVQSGMSSDASN